MATVYIARGPEKSYVGFTTRSLQERRREHLRGMNWEDVRGRAFASALIKYGSEAFEWTSLAENVSDDVGLRLEAYFIDKLGTLSPGGYNLKTGGVVGVRLSEETRRKISMSKMGRPMSATARANVSAAQLGKKRGPHSQSHRDAIGAANRGQCGWHHTLEAKQKIGRASFRLSVAQAASAAMLMRLGASERDTAKWFDVSRGSVTNLLGRSVAWCVEFDMFFGRVHV